MSIPHFGSADQGAGPQAVPAKVTFQTLQEQKAQRQPIAALTAYDYATARLVDEAGGDLILVGDSLAMVVMGYESTLPVTVDEMLHHTRAVRRAVKRAVLVADMPYGSYQVTVAEAVANAARFVKEAGAEGVKIEGGASRAELVERLTDAEIPVVGHLGLTPQSVHRMGGYRVQGKTVAAMRKLMDDGHGLEAAGGGVKNFGYKGVGVAVWTGRGAVLRGVGLFEFGGGVGGGRPAAGGVGGEVAGRVAAVGCGAAPATRAPTTTTSASRVAGRAVTGTTPLVRRGRLVRVRL